MALSPSFPLHSVLCIPISTLVLGYGPAFVPHFLFLNLSCTNIFYNGSFIPFVLLRTLLLLGEKRRTEAHSIRLRVEKNIIELTF